MTSEHDPVEILLVEDNPNDAELTLNALREGNLANHITWIKDGVEAVDFIFCRGKYESRLGEALPKVILLDLRLPKLDGLELLRILKNDSRSNAIPVVILTSSREDRDMAESYNLGVNSFISKPVEFDDFANVIKELGYYWLIVNQPYK